MVSSLLIKAMKTANVFFRHILNFTKLQKLKPVLFLGIRQVPHTKMV